MSAHSSASPDGSPSIDTVIATNELASRPSRPADFKAESRALVILARHLADSPKTILQKLVDVAVDTLHAGSAGVSLIDNETGNFYWPAIAGAWSPLVGGGTPREFGPCGTVLDRKAPQLFTRPERHFPYLVAANPPIEEGLLVPFAVDGKDVGTVWLISHDTKRRFDQEDCRVLSSLGEFAAAAFQTLQSIAVVERQSLSLTEAQAHLREDYDRLSLMHEAVKRVHSCTSLETATAVILDAVIALTGADKGNVQLLERNSAVLTIWEQRGFDEDFLQFFKEVSVDDDSACSRAMRDRTRILIEDVDQDERYASLRKVAAAASYRAVQSTPLTSSSGVLLGVLSTHFREPHVFSKHEQRVLDLFSRQAAEVIERTLKDKALVEAQERMDVTLSAARVGTWVVDPINDRVFADHHVARLFSVSPENAEGGRVETYLKVIHPDDLARVRTDLSEALKSEERYTSDYRILLPDGNIRWLSARGQVQRDAGGNACRMPGVIIDITEQRAAEEKELKAREALAERESFLDGIVSSSADCLKVLDLTGRLEWMSDGSLTAMEIPVFDSVAGADWPSFWKDGLNKKAEHALAVARAGGVGRFQGFCPTFKGTPRWWDVVVTPLAGPGGAVTRLLATSRDITHQHLAEEALTLARDEAVQAVGAKDRFLASLSHELRTPLNPILLLASEAAANVALPEAVRADFELIRKNVELETRLIEDLLDLTRATRGKMSMRVAPVDLASVLRDAVRNIQGEIDAKDLTLHLEVPMGLPQVPGDPDRLQQVFWNLMRNAVKFTPSKGTVRVVARMPAAEGMLRFEISDSGIGMSTAEIEKLFIPFSQGRHADGPNGSAQFGGLGLGLSISHRIMEMHGGRLSARSDGPGLGSTFILDFDLRAPASTAEPTPSQAPFVTAKAVRKLRILVVEDHESTRNTMKRLLEMRGHQVKVAGSAVEFRAAADFAMDLVLCDIGLPDITGHDLFREVRTRHPQAVGFALSGYGTEEDIQQARAAGFTEHVVKPVSTAMLDVLLVKHFSK